jgi:hypothetical protein
MLIQSEEGHVERQHSDNEIRYEIYHYKLKNPTPYYVCGWLPV